MNGKPLSLWVVLSAHDTVHHKAREYARGPVHINSAESSMIGGAALSRVYSITQSAFGRPLTSTRSDFTGRSGSSPARHRDGTAKDVRSRRRYGRGYRLPCSSQRCWAPHWTRDASNESWWIRPHLESSCLWLIMPPCVWKQILFQPLLRARPSNINGSSKAGSSCDRGFGGCRVANSASTFALTFGHRLVVCMWRNDRNADPILGTTGRGTVPCWRIGPL